MEVHLARLRFGSDHRQRLEIKIRAHHLYRSSHLDRHAARAASRDAMEDMRAHGIEIEAG